MTAETAVITAALEAGGPVLGAVAILWYRLQKLEQRINDRFREVRHDIDRNARRIGRDDTVRAHPLSSDREAVAVDVDDESGR